MKRRGLLLAIGIFATSSLLPSSEKNIFKPINMCTEKREAALLLHDYVIAALTYQQRADQEKDCTGKKVALAKREESLLKIEKLLEAFPTIAQVLTFTNNYSGAEYTCLMFALQSKDLELFEIFLPYSDLTQSTHNFSNFFDLLTQLDFQASDRGFLAALLATINESDSCSLKDFLYQNGYNSLMQALLQDDFIIQHQLVAFLLEHGANVNAPCPQDMAPIIGAIHRGYVPTIIEFLRRNVDLLVLNEDGISAESLITAAGMDALTNVINMNYRGICSDTIHAKLDALRLCSDDEDIN